MFNDLSLHGQFASAREFLAALGWLMSARQRVEKAQMQLRCHRGFLQAQATGTQRVGDIVRELGDRSRRRQIMAWINKRPFWEDERLHAGDEYFEVAGEIVTDTAVGEAATAVAEGASRTLVSTQPSSWLRTPIEVTHFLSDEQRAMIPVPNVWNDDQLERALREAEPPVQSWADLVAWAGRTCPHLFLADDVIASLDGWPFMANAAEGLQIRLKTLDRMRACSTEDGGLNDEGLGLRETYFVGKKAWFSDSSDREKNQFEHELTFKHPGESDKTLFCPWHGKVKIKQMRIHFSWPIIANEPIYVVYMGPKITKR